MPPNPNNPGEVLQNALIKAHVKQVRCHVCGASHPANGDTFLTIYGDIHLGIWHPLVGNNYSPEMTGVEKQFVLCKVTTVCRGTNFQNSCLGRLLFPAK